MHDRYENTEARIKRVEEEGLMYIGMGVSGGEEGARNGVLRPRMPAASHPASKPHTCCQPTLLPRCSMALQIFTAGKACGGSNFSSVGLDSHSGRG